MAFFPWLFLPSKNVAFFSVAFFAVAFYRRQPLSCRHAMMSPRLPGIKSFNQVTNIYAICLNVQVMLKIYGMGLVFFKKKLEVSVILYLFIIYFERKRQI